MEERRRYWKTLSTYSKSSLKDNMAEEQRRKRQVSRVAFLRQANDGDAPKLGPDMQGRIQHRNSISRAGGSWQTESVTALNTADHGEYGHELACEVVTTGEERRDVKDVGTTSGLMLNTAEGGVHDQEEERAMVTMGVAHLVVEEQHLKSSVRSSLLNTLLCRLGSAKPSFEQQVSRLPVHIAATLPARLKMKAGWGKKRHVVHFDMQQQTGGGPSLGITRHVPTPSHRNRTPQGSIAPSSSKPADASSSNISTFDRRLPTISRCSRIPGSAGGIRSSSLASTIKTRPDRAQSPASATNGHREALQARSRPTVIRSLESQASESRSLSLEERLRHTTLRNLPLDEGGAQRISQLMRDIEYNRYGTWPQPKTRRTVGDGVHYIQFDDGTRTDHLCRYMPTYRATHLSKRHKRSSQDSLKSTTRLRVRLTGIAS
jgi:hypothetical protein